MKTETDELTKALERLRPQSDFQTVIKAIFESRERWFDTLTGEAERLDAKKVGAMVQDDYWYKLFKG